MSIHPGIIFVRTTVGTMGCKYVRVLAVGNCYFVTTEYCYYPELSILGCLIRKHFSSSPVQCCEGTLSVWSWRSWQQSQSILLCFQLSIICFLRCMPFCVRSHLTMTSATPWLMPSGRLQNEYLVYLHFL